MMISKLKELQEESEDGFTLIEILVVILIIGILAAIAIPVFLNQRKTANDGAVESDVRNAATQIETWAATKQGGSVEMTQTDIDNLGLKKSEGVTLQVDGSSTHYCVRGWHSNGKKYILAGGLPLVYDSVGGGLGKPCTISTLSWHAVS